MNKAASKAELTYQEWMAAIDRFLTKRIGLDQDCLADWMSRDAYDDGMTVSDGVRECLYAQDMMDDDMIENIVY